MRSAGRLLMASGQAHVPATFVAAYEAHSTAITASGQATVTSASFTPNAGELLVVKALAWDQTVTVVAGYPTGGGLTWAQQVAPATTSGVANGGIWTAVAPAVPAAMTVAVRYADSSTSAGVAGFCVERWIGTLAATPATLNATGLTTVSSNALVATSPTSAITWADADYNGVAVTGTTYLSGAAQTTAPAQVSSGGLSTWYAWQRSTGASAQTVGMSAPTGQKATLVGIEILGT